MKKTFLTALTIALLCAPAIGTAQDEEDLRIAALEALMSAPPERATPIVQKVLAGDSSVEMKSRALFVLSQIDTAAARSTLAATARDSDGELQMEAIRMIGIGGHPDAMATLTELYSSGDADVRSAVLEAYLIAGDSDAVYRIALEAEDPQAFSQAVEMLGAMGATEQLRALRESRGASDALIHAYAIAGDVDSLEAIARDGSDPDRQVQALEALGVAGAPGATLAEIYRETADHRVRSAALQGLMIGGDDAVVLELFRASDDSAEKRQMLEMLVVMGSDEVWDIIDETLEGGQ